MQAKLRALDKRRTAAAGGGEESDDDDDDDAEDAGGASKKRRTGPSFLEQELAKYAAGRKGKRKGGKRDEDDVMAALSSFTGKLKRRADEDDDVDEQRGDDGSHGKQADVGLHLDDREDVEGIEVDDDVDFLKHALRAETERDLSESRRAESDYTVSRARPGPAANVSPLICGPCPFRSSIQEQRQKHCEKSVKEAAIGTEGIAGAARGGRLRCHDIGKVCAGCIWCDSWSSEAG